MRTATAAAANPTSIEFCVPAMTNDSMSTPASSQPSQCAGEGDANGPPLGRATE